jgi:hypothetical protein
MIRALIGGVSLAGILFAPAWVPFVGIGALAIRFRAWEVLVLGAIIDLVYVPPGGVWGIPIPATLFAFILLVLFEPIRQKLLL